MSAANFAYYRPTAYRADAIPSMPASSKKRERIGEELLPFGDYAGIDPYQQLSEDTELVQFQERKNKEFYKTNEWWWNNESIAFMKNSVGISMLILAIPFFYIAALFVLVLYFSMLSLRAMPSPFDIIFCLSIIFLGVPGVFVLASYTTQSVVNGIYGLISFLLTPIHNRIAQGASRHMANQRSQFNRQTGLASFAQGKKTPPLVVPFVEFDGYVERVIQRGGIFYRLMFVHRYTGKQFNQTSLSTIVDHKHEVHALWDMLQRYMDVSQPMPDVPRLEPFLHLDPTTAEHDQKTGRNPRYWRDLDLEAWKKGDGAAHLKAQIEYPWSRQRCQLTPQLGKVEMAAYREQQQAPVT